VTEAQWLLRRQVCPICGEGPWQSPLNHVSKRHGIDRFTMRDLCGLSTNDKVVDPELSDRFAERSRQNDMTLVNHKGKPRRKQRWTKAGAARNTATIEQQNQSPEAPTRRARALVLAHTPEARVKQAESMKAYWAAAPQSERDAARKRLARTSEELSEQSRATWARRGLQPCGTVAAYKRGCRCEACRQAKRDSRA